MERVFAKSDPAVVSRCCVHWLNEVADLVGVSPIAIDGKTLRGSASSTLRPLHLVSAWATEAKSTLGEVSVEGKSNEIKAIPELWKLLDLKGTLVTLDALGCQKAIAKQIVEQKGNEILAVKGNQEQLLEDLQTTVGKALEGELPKHPVSTVTTTEEGHGRKETRTYYTIRNVEGILGSDPKVRKAIASEEAAERVRIDQLMEEKRRSEAEEICRFFRF